MVEDNILNNKKKNKKKILLWSTIIVLVLTVIVIGTTYAFFTMGTINNSEDTEITITTGPRDNIKLTGGITNYKLHLEVVDMAFNRVNNNYYGTTDESKNYETEVEDGTKIIGNLELDGEFVDNYICDATVNVGLDGNMQSELQESDLVLVIIQGETSTEYDLSKSITSPSFEFDLNNIEPIKAYLKFTNQNTDQSGLAGKTLNVTINVADFKCEIEKSKAPLEMLKETGGEVFAGGGNHTTAVEGLYRFKGTNSEVTNNYICLGDKNPEKCKTNSDNMYRIIGVTDGTEVSDLGLEAGMLKVIKATPSNTSQEWASSYSSSYNYTWDDKTTNQSTGATARWYLNDAFYAGSTIDTRIKPYIANVYWWKGDKIGSSSNPPTSETKVKTTNQYQIGLMYASDYYNSWTYVGSEPYSTDGWLNICHGLRSGSPSCGTTYTGTNEWTMTRAGYVDDAYRAWRVYTDGRLDIPSVNNTFAVRPVFYLTPDIRLSGEGTESNPFTIS